MKTIIFSAVIPLLFLAACTGTDSKNETVAAKSTEAEIESAKKAGSADAVLKSYLSLKDALVSDNDKDAAKAGAEMVAAFVSFDKGPLNETQLKTFLEIQEVAKEHAEHIADNIGNIAHQREHFDMLSKDIYDLVKIMGSGAIGPLYVNHCPMYNDKKGAVWLTELKEIKNPYFGTAMSDCGSIQEELN